MLQAKQSEFWSPIEWPVCGTTFEPTPLAARVLAAASPRTVMTTSTVRELALGSGIDFDDRGSHELKGVPGTWRLFEATESQAIDSGG